jgi:hypothetical protein
MTADARTLGERLAEQVAGAPPAAPVTDPVAEIERRFGVTLWSAQRRVVESVHANRFTAVRAAHSVGKSKVAGLLAALWLASHPVGSAFVFVTAPRTAQVRGIVFREFARAHRDGELPGRFTWGQTPEALIGDELVAVGRSPADRVDPEEAATAMQGIHAEHLLVIADEAAGLAAWVWDAIDSLASNAGARVLALGNPTIRESRFFEVCQPGSGWESIRISAFDSPNLTGEQVPASVARNLVSAEWVDERARRWGRGSVMWRSRVEAEFPEADDDALVEPVWVEAAQIRELPEADGPATLAVDVARSARGDRTVIASLRGGRVRFRLVRVGLDTMEVSGQVARVFAEDDAANAIVVDEVGVGGGVLDRLKEQNLPTRGFNSASRARDPGRFKNLRAEAFWQLREQLREGRLDLPDDEVGEELAAELMALTWSVDSAGRIVIGAKSDLPRSPDLADAVAMAISDSTAVTQEMTFVSRRFARPLGHPEFDPVRDTLANFGETWGGQW